METLLFQENCGEEALRIDAQVLRDFNKDLFWNLVYYFNDYSMPFDFLLPYESMPEEHKVVPEKEVGKGIVSGRGKDMGDEVIVEEDEEDKMC